MKLTHFLSILFVFLSSQIVVAQGTSVAFGTLAQDTSAPIEVSSDTLSVDQNTGAATFTGNVVIGQGEMRLSAPQVIVVYNQNQTGIDKLEAIGGVTIVSGTDAAEAQRADYSVSNGAIVLSGDVLLAQGQSAISADKMTIDLSNGTGRMQGRVRTILQTGSGN